MKSRNIDYKDYEKYNTDREISKKDWSSGEEMSDIVKTRYKKIVKARYGTWDGLCFMTAGILLIGGSLPVILSKDLSVGSTAIILAIVWSLALCVMAGVIFIRRNRNSEMRRIDEGRFLWKLDEVYMVLPDRYPKANKILVKTEARPVFTLQAFFWFKTDDYVYVIKKTEDSDMDAFIY